MRIVDAVFFSKCMLHNNFAKDTWVRSYFVVTQQKLIVLRHSHLETGHVVEGSCC